MPIIKRIGPWVLLVALAGAPAYALKLLGAYAGLALYADTQIEEPPANNNARTLPEQQPGDTVRFQLFAPAAAGGTTNGYTVELDLPGGTFSDHVGSLSGMDWRGNALTSGGPATVAALILPAATVPATGYLGRIDLTLTGALTTGAVLAVKSMAMASGSEADSLDVSHARITFAGAGNAGDFNYDGSVNLADLLAFADMFGKASSEAGYDARGDFDNSGRIDLSDFVAFADVFGKTYPVGGNGGEGGGDDQRAGTIRRLTDNDARDFSPAWSPDGRKIAFASHRDGNYEIYVMDADASNPTNLTQNDALDLSPDWSPNGRQIAFNSYRDGNNEIYVMDADGGNPTNLTRNDAWDAVPAWSPDGRQIAFVSYRDGNWEIYLMGADGGNPTNLTRNDADDWSPAWSPDGRQIAFVSYRDGNDEIYVMDADGGNPTNLTHNEAGAESPEWSPDGRRIAFVSYRDGNNEIYVMDADGGNPRNLTHNDAIDWHPGWSPDGRQIAFVSGRDGNDEIYLIELREAVGARRMPDLVVDTPSVSSSNPNAGATFTLQATVRNRGSGASGSATLRYFSSSDATISTSDTEVGKDAVGGLAASGGSAQSIDLTAPSSPGTYYFGACVDAVSGESDTGNNCSSAAGLTVSTMPPAGTWKLYWSERGAESIRRSNLDGSGVENLVTTGLGAPGGIALDVAGGKMYWTDEVADMIQRSNLDGSGIEDLVTTGLRDPGSIALDVAGGKIYWTHSRAEIQRSNLDGSDVENLIAGLDAPGGIALGLVPREAGDNTGGGEPPQPVKAVTGSITDCSFTYANFIYTIRIVGTVRAIRRVTNLTLTGYVGGQLVNVLNLGTLSAGQSRSFTISGISGSRPGGRCEISMEWTERSGQSRSILEER